MSEEQKDVNIDEEIDKILNDPSIKTEEEKNFIKEVGNSLKRGEIPINLIVNKFKEAETKLDGLKETNPEFESFVNHYKKRVNDEMQKMTEMLQSMSNGK